MHTLNSSLRVHGRKREGRVKNLQRKLHFKHRSDFSLHFPLLCNAIFPWCNFNCSLIVRLVKNYAFNHSLVPCAPLESFQPQSKRAALERLEKGLRRREVLTARWSGENYRQRESQSWVPGDTHGNKFIID